MLDLINNTPQFLKNDFIRVNQSITLTQSLSNSILEKSQLIYHYNHSQIYPKTRFCAHAIHVLLEYMHLKIII